MPEKLNLLFVCSRNRWRSPTAERVYARDQRVNVRSRGTSRQAERTIRAEDLHWADLILVMEQTHQQRLQSQFPGEVEKGGIHVLDIPDEYEFMDETLIALLRESVEAVLGD